MIEEIKYMLPELSEGQLHWLEVTIQLEVAKAERALLIKLQGEL